MKYLKRFNESVDIKSNIGEIKQTIREILLPISDMGYEISVTNEMDFRFSFEGELTGVIIRVVSYTDPSLKMEDQVKDEFIRMNDYLKSSGFNSVRAIYVEGSNYRFDEDFNKFIILEDCELKNILFVAKVN